MDMELPHAFVARLSEILGDRTAQTAIQHLHDRRAVAWRVNELLAAPELVTAELEKVGVPICEGWNRGSAWATAEFRERVTHHRFAETGELYVQSLASQFASLLLDPQPGETVLDLAAAPGGKASHLAALMKNQGELCVVEPIRPRFFRLRANLHRLGVKIAKFFMTDGRTVGRKVPEKFHRILLDAPCSSESRFCVGQPETFRTWSLRKIRECQRKQIGLIQSAFQALRPGGRLVYCTCSFAPEENELVVTRLLEHFPEQAELSSIDLDPEVSAPGLTSFAGMTFAPKITRCRRLLPSDRFDGFFYAVITKAG